MNSPFAPGGRKFYVAPSDIGSIALPEKNFSTTRIERIPGRIVCVDHGVSIRLEVKHQRRFRGEVCLHRAVIVEMIAREIGENGRPEFQSVDSLLVETVRRDFHRDPLRATIDEHTQYSLQLDRTRCGELSSTGNDFPFCAKQYAKRTDRRASM